MQYREYIPSKNAAPFTTTKIFQAGHQNVEPNCHHQLVTLHFACRSMSKSKRFLFQEQPFNLIFLTLKELTSRDKFDKKRK